MQRLPQHGIVAAVAAAYSVASAAAACPDRTVLTSNCTSICLGAAVCIQYSHDFAAQVDPATFTSTLNRDANGCVFRCLSSTTDEASHIFSVRIPLSDEPSGRVDIAALALPANATGLDLTVDSTEAEVFGFPDGNIVANGSQLHFLGLHNVLPDPLPMAIFDLPIATLRLELTTSDIPSSIVRFKTVNTLNLDSCTLSDFPFSQVIASMPQVRNLSLSDNIITEIPVNNTTQPFYASSALLTLALAKNQLITFDAVFASLRSLDLQENQLRSFPTSMAKMQLLQELKLDRNSLNSTLIEDQLAKTGSLPTIQRLSLSRCGLRGTLPAAFPAVFTNLFRLDLSQNSIESISSLDLPGQSLEELYLASNTLKFFSGSFPRLKILDVSGNALDSLPDSLPSSLTTLNASSNALVSLNISNLSSLDILDLSWNKLNVFPDAVWSATKLSVLHLQGNINMAPINVTPDQLQLLQNIRELKIDETGFSTLGCPANSISTVHGYSVCEVRSSTDDSGEKTGSTNTKSSSNNTRTAGLIASVVLIVAGIVFGIAAYLHSRKKGRRRQRDVSDEIHRHEVTDDEDFEEAPTTTKKSMMFGSTGYPEAKGAWVGIAKDETLRRLRVDLSSVRFFKVVGTGAFGQVWRGTCRTSTTESRHVAIKTLSRDTIRDRQACKRFIAQVKLQATLSHPRIVTAVGVAWNSPIDLCALMEFMPRGDLFATLHYSSASSCSSSSALFQSGVWGETKLQIALDTIEALSFAHAQSPAILHRDLKSRNVLLDAHGRAKLADFDIPPIPGDANFRSFDSPLWMAPEVIIGTNPYDEKADIFSFGVILSELDTHEVPYGYEGSATAMLASLKRKDKTKASRHEEAKQLRILHQIATGELRPKFSRSCPSAIHEIALRCLSEDPTARPSAVEVSYLLRRVERDGSDVRVFVFV